MSPSLIDTNTVLHRLEWIDRMINEIHRLPLHDQAIFLADSRNIWTAESCLRRSLEAMLDLGRHILAKGFAISTNEYKEIGSRLGEQKVLSTDASQQLRTLAGYRNRLTHYYHDVTAEELFHVCARELTDVITITDEIRQWLHAHQNLLNRPISPTTE